MKNLVIPIVTICILLFAQIGLVEADSQAEKRKYIASVVSLLRIHAQAIQQLSSNTFKYSENLARHANAIKQTFGLLGPMDWHITKSASLYKRSDNELQMDEELFEQLADSSSKALKTLHSTAIKEIQGGNEGLVIEALNDMQKTCEQCHALLPKGIAPDVWNVQIPPGN